MTTPLYPRLLGSSWGDLAEVVRRHHLDGETLRASGTFQVRHGDSRLSRLLARLAGVPPAGNAISTRLVIMVEGNGERWDRSFGQHWMITWQCGAGAGQLWERFGLMELRFALQVENGTLIYHQTAARLRLGPLAIPLPVWLAPRVKAQESPDDKEHQTRVAVEVTLPLIGRLVSYSGTLSREGVS